MPVMIPLFFLRDLVIIIIVTEGHLVADVSLVFDVICVDVLDIDQNRQGSL